MEGIIDLNITMSTLHSQIPFYLFFLKKIPSKNYCMPFTKVEKNGRSQVQTQKVRLKSLDIDKHLLWFD